MRPILNQNKYSKKSENHYFVDFGKAAFGTVVLTLNTPEKGEKIEVYLGEKKVKGESSVDRSPGGTIRHKKITQKLRQGRHAYRIAFRYYTKQGMNSEVRRLLAPIGEVMPFRYCEIKSRYSNLNMEEIVQVGVWYPFEDGASEFESSHTVLNDVWELSKYSVIATNFLGIYIDGDRERKPYEADAYIHQLGHYNVDREFTMARHSHEYLLDHPTWPAEWKLHSILMAWADYLYSGDIKSLRTHYDQLKTEKCLIHAAREDGLIVHAGKSVVDWPPSERDGYVKRGVNTVVNAFYYRGLILLAKMAAALEKSEDVEHFLAQAELM